MDKKKFNQMVNEIGLDATLKFIRQGSKKKTFCVHLTETGKKVSTKPKYKSTKKVKNKLKKLNHVNFDELNKDLNKSGLSYNAKLKKIGKFLNKNCPKSEQWFMSLYKAHFVSKLDEFNKPFRSKYIPDVSNLVHKYIIEIDGSIHETPEQIEKDRIKDLYYKEHGFVVIRVQAYNNISYIEAIKQLFILRHKKRMPNPDFFQFVKQNSVDIMSLGML